MKNFLSAFASALVVCLCVALPARGDCSAAPTVSVSVSPQPNGIPIVTVPYSFPDTTSSTQRALSLRLRRSNGGFGTVKSIQPADASGVMVVNHDMFCEPSGTYTYEAVATSCNTHTQTGTATYEHNVKPTVSVTYAGPDDQGHGQLIVDYEFPNTSDASQRSLVHRVWQGAGFGTAASFRPTERSGTWVTNYNMTCKTGTFEHEVTATTCSGEFDKDRDPVTVNTMPSVSVSPGPIQDNGNVELTVNYGFPNTDNKVNRSVLVRIQDEAGGFGTCATRQPTDQYGVFTVTCSVACDKRNLKAWVIAKSCSGEQAEDKKPMPKAESPSVSVALSKAKSQPGWIDAKIDYDMGKGTGSWSIKLNLLTWINANGQTVAGGQILSKVPSTRTGTITHRFAPPSGAQQITVQAAATNCVTRVTDTASIECDSCENGATKDPVFLTSGNVRVTDADPLPAVGTHGLLRTYNSDEQVVALFGRGWTTLFDRRMIVNADGTEQVVSLVSETNQVVTFRGANGQFRQVWPKGRQTVGSLTYAAASGTYVHRPAGSSEAEVFRASDGRLVALRDLATGRVAAFVYGPDGLPQSLTDSWSGTSWNLTIDTVNRRVSSIAVNGQPTLTWSYAYDAAGNLLSVTAPGSRVWRTYTYASNRMTASYDAAGNLIESHTYDAGGWGITSTGPSDEIASIAYDLPGSVAQERLTRVTYKTGRVAEYAFRPVAGAYRTVLIAGGCSSCGDATYVHDAAGRVVREQGATGYVTVNVWGAAGLASQQQFLRPAGCDPATDAQHCRLDPDALAAAQLDPTPATVTTAFHYDDPLWPDRATSTVTASVMGAELERGETVAYDAASGQVLMRSVRGWTGAPLREETRATVTALYDGTEGAAFAPGGAFDAAWLLLPQPRLRKSVDGPREDVADVRHLVYYPIDPSVPASWRGRLAAARNAAGHMERYEDYDLYGTALRTVDANGVVQQRVSDDLGRPVSSTIQAVPGCDTQADPLCNVALTHTRLYSGAGPLASEERPGGGVVSYQYDSRGRLSTMQRGPSLADPRERLTIDYDPLTGQKSLERWSALESGTWVERKRESYVYDTAGRVARVVHADASFQAYTYDPDGRVLTVQDENHASPNTTYEYDPTGRVSAVVQKLASAPGGTVATRYAYDLHGNLVSVTDPNGNTTSYAVDDFGQILAQTSPVTGTTSSTYDIAGQLRTVTDANGATTTRSYDALGRVLTVTAVRSGASEETAYVYDAGAFGAGRRTSMTDPAGSTSYSYERRGMLLAEQKTIGTSSYTTRFAYDRDGNRTHIAYPSGLAVDTLHDFASRPVSMTAGAQPVVAGTAYLPFGPASQVAFGNGTTRTMTYDNRYRILTNGLTGSGGAIASYDYGYDSNGNVTRIGDLVTPAYDRTFGYDDLNRLTAANTGAALWGSGTFAYDAMGSLTSSVLGTQTRAFTYAGTTPKIVTATEDGVPRGVTYDAAGNEKLVGSATFDYTPRNHLASDGVASYVYDGRGIRTIAAYAPPAPDRHYLYTPELHLLAEATQLNGLGSVDAEYLWFAGQPAAQVETATGTVHYYFNDHLGTPVLTTDASGAIDWRVEREPYGRIADLRAGAQRHQPLAFPGQEDSSAETSYNIFRWYRGGWGRYTQSDPLDSQIAGVINGYRYTLSNPLRWIDPTGLESQHTSDNINCIANPIDCARVYKCVKEATDASEKKFGYAKDGSPQNAYKHCYWNCCMTKIIGPVEAKKFGDAHENYPGNSSCDKDMDLWNNEQGRKVTGSTTCDSHCENAPLQKWRKCQPCGLDPWRNARKW